MPDAGEIRWMTYAEIRDAFALPSTKAAVQRSRRAAGHGARTTPTSSPGWASRWRRWPHPVTPPMKPTVTLPARRGGGAVE